MRTSVAIEPKVPTGRRYRGIGPEASGGDGFSWHRTRGRQRFSWVHIDDVVGALRFLRDHPAIDGPVNVASPHPVDDRMATLRRRVRMAIGLPAFRWMLEPAMWVVRTEPELVLKSRWVVPGVLTEAGYAFTRPRLDDAV